MDDGPVSRLPDEAVVAEMLRLTSRAGYSERDQQELRDAISIWLPRFFHRTGSAAREPVSLESVLVELVARYTRRLTSQLTEG